MNFFEILSAPERELPFDYHYYLRWRGVEDSPNTRVAWLTSKRKGQFERLYYGKRRRERTGGRYWGRTSSEVHLNGTYVVGSNAYRHKHGG